MKGERRVGLRIGIEQSILDHQPRARVPLFAGLEHELHGARQLVAMAMQEMHCLHQHGRVRVVAASMHASLEFTGKVEARFLGHGERIHVAAQKDGAAALRAGPGAHERDDEAGGRGPPFDLHIEPFDPVEHGLGGQRKIETQFRLGVNAAAQVDRGRQHVVGFTEQMRKVGQG